MGSVFSRRGGCVAPCRLRSVSVLYCFFGGKLASLDTSALVVETVWAGRRGQTCFVSFVSPTRPTSLQGMLEGMEMWIVGRRSRWGIGKTYPRVRLSGTRHATPLNDWIQSIRSNPMDSIEWILLIGAGRLTQGHQIYIKNCRAFLAWPGLV